METTETATTPMEITTERKALRWVAPVAFLLAALVAFSFAFTPLRTSNDEFWHLKTGKWIAEHRTLPRNDIFSSTSENDPWHNHEWLTQVLMWKLYQFGEWGKANLWDERSDFGGWGMIILVKACLVMLAYAGFGMLVGWRMRRPEWAALAAVMAAALARRTFYPRPPVITYLILGLVFWVMIEWREGRLRARWLWLLAPLFALWSNLHGGWQAGLAVIGAFWVDAAWNLVVAWWQARKLSLPPHEQFQISNFKFQIPFSALRNLFFLSSLGLACLLASGLNPSGFHLFELTARVMGDKYLVPRINELQPPRWEFMWVAEGVTLALTAAALRPVRLKGWLAALALLAAMHFAWWLTPNPWPHLALTLGAAGAAILRLRRLGWVAHLVVIAFFTFQGYMHVRHLTLMAVVLLPTLAWALEAWAERVSACGEKPLKRFGDVAQATTTRLKPGASEKEPTGEENITLDEAPNAIPEGRRFRDLASPAVALGVLAALAGFWFFSPWEGPSFIRRNLMLAAGMEIQPVMVNTAIIKWPTPSHLPAGFFFMDAYPVKAVDFLVRAGLPAPLWNGGNYAGYLIWRLSPEKMKVFTDNRYDIYGSKYLRQEHSVTEGWSAEELTTITLKAPRFFEGPPPPPWNKVLDQYQIQTVFIEAGAPGNHRLAQGGWVRVWEDYDYNIWVRDTPQNKPAIERALALPRPVTARPVVFR